MLQPSYKVILLFAILSLSTSPLSASPSPSRRSTINSSSQVSTPNNFNLYPNYNNTNLWELATTDDFIGFLDSNYGIAFINRSSASYSSSFHPDPSFSDIGGLFADSTTGLFGVFYSSSSQLFLATIDPLLSNSSTTSISPPPSAASCNTTKAPVTAFYANRDTVSLTTLPFEVEHGRSRSSCNLISGLGYITANSKDPTTPLCVFVIDTFGGSVVSSFFVNQTGQATDFVEPIISVDEYSGQVWLLTSSNTFSRFNDMGTSSVNFTSAVPLTSLGVDSRDGECYIQWYQDGGSSGQSYVLSSSQNNSTPLTSYSYLTTSAIHGNVFIDTVTNFLWGTDVQSNTPVFMPVSFSDVNPTSSPHHPITFYSTTPSPSPSPSPSPTSPPSTAPTNPPPMTVAGILTARVTQTIEGQYSAFHSDRYGALLANLLGVPRANVSCEAYNTKSTDPSYSVTTTFTLYTTNVNQDHSELAKRISTAMHSVTANNYFTQECSATLTSTSNVEMVVLTLHSEEHEHSNHDTYTIALGLGVGLGLGMPIVGLSISFYVYRKRKQAYKVGVMNASTSGEMCGA